MKPESNKDAICVALPGLVRLEQGDGQVVSPAYSSQDYQEFCEREKAKGLRRDLWDTLPQMWEEELKFRAEFEGAITRFSEPSARLSHAEGGKE